MAEPSSERITDLDGLRGVAVGLVLLWHFVGCLVNPSSWLGADLYSATIFGRTGVDLFFVLSGFLIIGILIDNKDAPARSYFLTFYVRRIGRIFPAYLLLIAIYWLLYWITGPNYAFNTDSKLIPQFAYQIGFAFNWLLSLSGTEVARGFQVTWSVALEEQFYLVIPLIVCLTPKSRLPRTLAGLALASILARVGFQLWQPHIGLDWNLALYTLPLFRFDTLCTGGLIAIAWRNERLFNHIREQSRSILGLVTALAAVAPVLVTLEMRNQMLHMNLWGHLYLELFYGSILLFVLANPGFLTVLRSGILQFLGKVSYGVYLFHCVAISIFFIAAGRDERFNNSTDVILAIGALILTFGFSYLSFRFFETPIRQFSHRSKYRGSFANRLRESSMPLNGISQTDVAR